MFKYEIRNIHPLTVIYFIAVYAFIHMILSIVSVSKKDADTSSNISIFMLVVNAILLFYIAYSFIANRAPPPIYRP